MKWPQKGVPKGQPNGAAAGPSRRAVQRAANAARRHVELRILPCLQPKMASSTTLPAENAEAAEALHSQRPPRCTTYALCSMHCPKAQSSPGACRRVAGLRTAD